MLTSQFVSPLLGPRHQSVPLRVVGIVALRERNGMTVEPKSMANKYQVAQRLVWQKLALWQQTAVREDREKQLTNPNFDSHVLNDFARKVIEMAESDGFMEATEKTPSVKIPVTYP